MKAYIGCGLTHVPRDIFGDHTDFIHGLAHALEHCTPPHTVRYALRDSDPQLASKPFEERAHLCYLWDRSMVKDADVLIAEPSFPSIGLGIEMQVAQTKDILVILCFRDFGTNRAAAVRYETPDHLKADSRTPCSKTLHAKPPHTTLRSKSIPVTGPISPRI